MKPCVQRERELRSQEEANRVVQRLKAQHEEELANQERMLRAEVRFTRDPSSQSKEGTDHLGAPPGPWNGPNRQLMRFSAILPLRNSVLGPQRLLAPPDLRSPLLSQAHQSLEAATLELENAAAERKLLWNRLRNCGAAFSDDSVEGGDDSADEHSYQTLRKDHGMSPLASKARQVCCPVAPLAPQHAPRLEPSRLAGHSPPRFSVDKTPLSHSSQVVVGFSVHPTVVRA